MRLTIDNGDGRGICDYTANIGADRTPQVSRKLNQPSRLQVTLVASGPDFLVPAANARVVLERTDGTKIFTGYVSAVPDYEYLGWGERGPVYRYLLTALSDEFLLDRKSLPERAPFVRHDAGSIAVQLATDLLPGLFAAQVSPTTTLPSYTASTALKWSEQAATLGLLARSAYRVHDGKLYFGPIGKDSYVLDEGSATFCPGGLILQQRDRRVNDVTVTGKSEPGAYVKDYFLGDGASLSFALSHLPFARYNQTVVEEEFAGTVLDSCFWTKLDPAGAISVNAGKLCVSGGSGTDGGTTVRGAEQIEVAGAVMLQHGDVQFTTASSGIIGGLYDTSVDSLHCVVGFRVSPSGTQSVIAPIVNGTAAGTTVTAQTGHRYTLTLRCYGTEQFRSRQTYHSSEYPAGQSRGGDMVGASVRVLLEVHDVDPNSAGTQAAASTVLYDGTINTPGFCIHAPVNSANLHCTLSYVRVLRAAQVQVGATLCGQNHAYLVGSLSEGGQCFLTDDPALGFYPAYLPPAQEAIRVAYRASQLSVARVVDTNSMAAIASGADDGIRASRRAVVAPAPRTSTDCENAALAMLDDTTQMAWTGEYSCESNMLPESADDLFPGAAIIVNAPSRNANFTAIVREVNIEARDLDSDRSRYTLHFANDAAATLAFGCDVAHLSDPVLPIETAPAPANAFLADLPQAVVTDVSSIAIGIDAGTIPAPGGGIEVRRSDAEWGAANDRNLVGRYMSQTFTLPRLSRVQTYYLRQYDAGSPPRYSRYSSVLHVDYPL